MNRRDECTAETMGIIIDINKFGDPMYILTVEYEVDGHTYRKNERITAEKTETIRLFGILPIGYKSDWKIKDPHLGDRYAVIYEPSDPENAFIKQNDGHWS